MQSQDTQAEELRELIAELLARMEQEGEAAIETACGEYPAHADAIRRRIAQLRRTGLLDELPPEVLLDIPDRLGDFQLLERVGGGGMGIVYRAEQISLEREVAIKLIRPDQLHLGSARERFAREVSIVAGLKHPAIVPVFSVGEEASLPYFAMEYVEGCTLEEALRSLVGRDPSRLAGLDLAQAVRTQCGSQPLGVGETLAELFQGSWEQTTLRIVRTIAEALSYSHANDVLHRDVKPSNVMITADGRVMLFDFGLSRAEDSSELTRSTTRLGSLPYLPPEQLDEKEVSFSPRADVYSLGVTLYQLLSLRTPFAGDTAPELYMKVLAGEPPALRKVNRSVSWETETVCRKAMERDPARRYGSADELSRDLENVLNHKPVEARRANLALRLRRWSQRNPGRAVAVFLGTSLAAISLATLFQQQQGHLLAMTEALRETESERARAVQNLDNALEAIERMLGRVGEHKLEDVPQMDGVRGEILEDALDLYRELLGSNPGHERIEFLYSRMHRELGDVLELLGRNEEAQLAYAAHIEASRAALRRTPSDPELLAGLAESLNSYGLLLLDDNDSDRAGLCFEEALAILRELTTFEPDPMDYVDVGIALHNLALWLYEQGKLDQALRSSRECIGEIRHCLELVPGDAHALESLAAAHSFEGEVLAELGQRSEAEAAYRAAFGVLDELLELNPASKALSMRLGNMGQRLGLLLSEENRTAEAMPFLSRAIELTRDLAAKNPGVPKYRVEEANTSIIVALALVDSGQPAQAQTYLVAAIELLEVLTSEYPGALDYRAGMGAALSNLSNVSFRLGQFDQALEQASKSVAIHRDVLDASPEHPAYRRQLAAAIVALAHRLAWFGLHREAAREIAQIPDLLPRESMAYRDLAATYQECSRIASGDRSLGEAERRALSEEYLGLGLDALMRALELGYSRERIMASKDLAALRQLPGFDEALAKQ